MAKKREAASPLDRAINVRERGIRRMLDNIDRIQRIADAEIAEVRKRIDKAKVLLDALKRGALKP